ncbi:streptophobe family protein [Streptomyces maremycinicus]|uniref:streptophobe family protein n=1 Tax=Streptomyces maremycinicus TaxID=1679753 RepID=UPI0007875F50|nr:streptophobe family protein [Streptomyces sp. NBRC 110468]
MSAGTGVGGSGSEARDRGVPWIDVLLAAVAAVSWALIGMAGTAALGLHLLEADSAGSLGPMTAAVVALAAGGSVTPSGDVSAFGLTGAEAATAIEITPLGVSLVGALLLSWFFLRSLRAAGVVVAPAELLARVGTVVALYVAMLGGLVWAGHDVITLDGGALGLDDLPGGGGGGGGGGGPEIPGLGDIGGLLPDRLGDLVDAKAAVGFTVDTAPTLLGGLGWSLGILLIALLASRRTPLPAGWEAVHRVVRPAVSAVVTVLLVAVAAGFAAAAYAAIGDDHPRRIAGAALLGAPNGVWLGIPIGLFVPWDGRATGALTGVLPDPLDDLLGAGTERPVTLGRLAELDGRVWLLGVAAALMMLLAGVLAAVRTPVPPAVRTRVRSTGFPPAAKAGSGAAAEAGSWSRDGRGDGSLDGSGAGIPDGRGAGLGTRSGAGSPDGRGAGGWAGAVGFAGRCAVRLGVATAVALPLLAWLTDVSVDASLSVLGFDAFGAGIDLHGRLGAALLLGAVWGAGAGAAGALLAWATGAAGRWAAPLARSDPGGGAGPGAGHGRSGYPGDRSGPYAPGAPSYRPPNPATNPYLRVPEELRDAGPERARPGPDGRDGRDGRVGRDGPSMRDGRDRGDKGGRSRPYESSRPTEPPSGDAGPPAGPPGADDVYGAPTVIRPMGPSPRSPRRPAGPRPGERPRPGPEEGPPPPPPPPPAPPRGPRTPGGPR